MSYLAPLDAYCSGLLASLESSERRKLARTIAATVRANQVKRIAAQLNPDGSAYVPRKPQKLRGKKGRIRRSMFTKLRTARYLKTEISSESAIISFAGEVQRIAKVHQLGLRDKVNRRKNIEVKYDARELLGITQSDVSLVADLVISHLAR